MGIFIDGFWHVQEVNSQNKEGEFKRKESVFRNFIGKEEEFPIQKDRYHLYLSKACPWAHRTLIYLKLKDLDQIISHSFVHPYMDEHGWSFAFTEKKIKSDPTTGCERLKNIYLLSDSKYSGRVTVPVLWDKKVNKIVNNESADIIQMFNHVFNSITHNRINLYPQKHQKEIDKLNEYIYENINNGVYKVGFSRKQTVYETHLTNLFKALQKLDKILENKKFLTGDYLTETDIRLFTTLIRFDLCYHYHFKCNLKKISDLTFLFDYLKALYQVPLISETCDFAEIKTHYYLSHPGLNPNRIIPMGPILNFKGESHRKVSFFEN